MTEKPKTDHESFLREDIPEEVMEKLRAAYKSPRHGRVLPRPRIYVRYSVSLEPEVGEEPSMAPVKEADLPSRSCPSPETVIAYALEELPPEERAQVQAHLSGCRDCLELVLDVRTARAEAQEGKQEVRDAGPVAVKSRKWLTEFVGRLQRLASGLLALPQLAPAAVAVSVVLAVVGLGLHQHLKAPIGVQLDLVARTSDGLLTRGSAGETDIKIPPGGVLRSGDRFQIVLETNKEAYAYVFFQDSAGRITILFAGKMQGKKRHKLPAEDNWFKLDETTGLEQVLVMAAKDPVVNLDEVVQLLTREGIGGLQKAYPQSSFQFFSFQHQ